MPEEFVKVIGVLVLWFPGRNTKVDPEVKYSVGVCAYCPKVRQLDGAEHVLVGE